MHATGSPTKGVGLGWCPGINSLSFNVQEHQCPMTQVCQMSQRQSHTNETTDITACSQTSAYLSYENNVIAKGTDKSALSR